MNEEKLKALDAVLTQIEKAYGKGAIMNAFRSTSHSASAGFPAAE